MNMATHSQKNIVGKAILVAKFDYKTFCLVVLLMAVFTWAVGSMWWAQNPHAQDLSTALQPASRAHWLGTDHLGRDVLARLAEGMRVSLGLAVASASLTVLFGCTLGLLAAWRGGWVLRLSSVAADGVSAIPALLWVLLIAALAPGQKWALYIGLVLTAWVEFFRYVQPTARSLLLGEPVQASRLLGFSSAYILRWHIWPSMAASLVKLWSYAVAAAVLALAALGFVGVGIRPPTAELGLMMTEAMPYYREVPLLLLAPVCALLVSVLLLQALARKVAHNASEAQP
jgi:peptide/nickel transport system permease protein